MKANLRERWRQVVALIVLAGLGAIVLQTGGNESEAIEMVHRLGGIWKTEGGWRGDHVVRVNLNDTDATDADLQLLFCLRHLRSLGIGLTRVTDAGLASLADHPSLAQVDVEEGKATRQTIELFADRKINLVENPADWLRRGPRGQSDAIAPPSGLQEKSLATVR